MDLFPITDSIHNSLQTNKVQHISAHPVYPLIRKLNAHIDTSGDIWFSCVDIYKELQSTVSKQYIQHCGKKYDHTKKKQINLEWNYSNSTWEQHVSTKVNEVLMVKEEYLKEFVKSVVNKARKTKSQKLDLLKKFNIILTCDEKKDIKIPIECSVLDIFIKACPFTVETQYRIGKYRLDAYISRLKIAIQIDENGHKHYDKDEEKVYNTVMRDHNIVCIRFIPDEKEPVESGLKLVNIIWERTLSPDFNTFSAQYKLG
jgi:hypothetical protein